MLTQPSAAFPTNLPEADEHEFAALAEPHRRELQVHCYRMTGSFHDAEDLVQETFLRAWRRRETYAGRAPFRAWLYKIATNTCLDLLERRPPRGLPITRQAASTPDEPIPDSIHEPIWLEPYPDELVAPDAANPEARYSTQESVSLAFLAALHLLPPRQRAALILRDVLDWSAGEAADLLGQSVPAVKSALHRARKTLAGQAHAGLFDGLPARAADDALREQLDRYVSAWEAADADRLAELLRDEATFSMPPIPSWYRGRAAIRGLVARTVFSGRPERRWRLRPTRANGQPAFGLYRWDEAAGAFQPYGLQVVTFDGDGITDVTTFRDPALTARFDLPSELPA